MVRLQLPVPSGFTCTIDSCQEYYQFKEHTNGENTLPHHFLQELKSAVQDLEHSTGRCFGVSTSEDLKKAKASTTADFPLLLSVRGSVAHSMPVTMDTVLNLGVNDRAIAQIISATKNPSFAFDIHRRFLQMFGTIVLGLDKSVFESMESEFRTRRGILKNSELSPADLQEIIASFKSVVVVPDDPWDQLTMTVIALFESWYSPRAVNYGDIHNIPDNVGTGIIVQSMVYGNMNARSGSGICFTRNPSTGEKVFLGEYLMNSEGRL